MRKSLIIFLLLSLFASCFKGVVAAQELLPLETSQEIFRSTGDWEKKWEVLTLGVVGLTFLVAVDGEIYNFVQDNKSQFTEGVAKYIGPMGGGTVVLPGFLAGYTLGKIREDKRLLQALGQAWESYLISGLLVTMGKQLTHRHRPSHGADPHRWEGPKLSTEHLSFPSGHSATAFSLATSFAEVYKESHPWLPCLTYSLAGLVAFSRVHESHHWASDVFVGSVLGWAVARQVGKIHQEEKQEGGKWRIDLARGPAVTWEWSF